MKQDRLKIVSVDHKENISKDPARPKSNREEAQAYFERQWHLEPETFNPLRNCMERERIDRTLAVLPPLEGARAADLGCGACVLSKMMRDRGADVTAVDIAKNALEAFRQKNGDEIALVHDYVPHTKLEDESFDIVVCADLIGYMNPREHRLLISELARLVKKDGHVLISTPIDIDSEDALEKFAALAETELDITSWTLSYHSLYIRKKNFLKAPRLFAKAWKDADFKKRESASRGGLSRWWFRLNSSPIIGGIWNILQYLTNPLYRLLNQSRPLLLLCEKFCRALKGESAVSHAIFLAKRRPLVTPEVHESEPVLRRVKKRVWE